MRRAEAAEKFRDGGQWKCGDADIRTFEDGLGDRRGEVARGVLFSCDMAEQDVEDRLRVTGLVETTTTTTTTPTESAMQRLKSYVAMFLRERGVKADEEDAAASKALWGWTASMEEGSVVYNDPRGTWFYCTLREVALSLDLEGIEGVEQPKLLKPSKSSKAIFAWRFGAEEADWIDSLQTACAMVKCSQNQIIEPLMNGGGVVKGSWFVEYASEEGEGVGLQEFEKRAREAEKARPSGASEVTVIDDDFVITAADGPETGEQERRTHAPLAQNLEGASPRGAGVATTEFTCEECGWRPKLKSRSRSDLAKSFDLHMKNWHGEGAKAAARAAATTATTSAAGGGGTATTEGGASTGESVLTRLQREFPAPWKVKFSGNNARITSEAGELFTTIRDARAAKEPTGAARKVSEVGWMACGIEGCSFRTERGERLQRHAKNIHGVKMALPPSPSTKSEVAGVAKPSPSSKSEAAKEMKRKRKREETEQKQQEEEREREKANRAREAELVQLYGPKGTKVTDKTVFAWHWKFLTTQGWYYKPGDRISDWFIVEPGGEKFHRSEEALLDSMHRRGRSEEEFKVYGDGKMGERRRGGGTGRAKEEENIDDVRARIKEGEGREGKLQARIDSLEAEIGRKRGFSGDSRAETSKKRPMLEMTRFAAVSVEERGRSRGDVGQGRECTVCMLDTRSVLFLPCLHLVCCKGCSKEFDDCFYCEAVIEERVEGVLLP